MSDFSARVQDGLRRRGLTLRQLCRTTEVDPSFFSKVLAGKRSPPSEEAVLRRIASTLELDAAQLIVSAGRIPAEWARLSEPELFKHVHALVTGTPAKPARPAAAPAPRRAETLSEELL